MLFRRRKKVESNGHRISTKAAVHTVPHGDKWAVRRAGASRASRLFETKMEAQVAGRATAKRVGVDHVVHRSDGTIGRHHRYE